MKALFYWKMKIFFTPVSQVNYTFYRNKNVILDDLIKNENVQCIVGEGLTAFGKTQQPGLFDYADGIDVMEFLLRL